MKRYWTLLTLFLVGFIVSGINPHDHFTWILEVLPSIIGAIVLIFTFKTFKLSNLAYSLILVHCFILFVGGHYTYAEVPLFNWVKEVFDHSRNNYDKLGHFAQGFVPSIIIREILIRKMIVRKEGWLAFLTVCICVTISVLYEFFEWSVAIASGQSAEAFLGTQGYVWDTQSDILCAMIGSICMIIFLAKYHDSQIESNFMSPKN